MEKWQETVLWIISIASFLLSISKWIFDIHKHTPRITIRYNSWDSSLVIFNPSKDIFTIDSIRVHEKKDANGYGIYPSFKEVSKASFQLKPNQSFRREIKPDKLSSYFMRLKTPTKIYFRIDTSEGKIFTLKKELEYFYFEKERYIMNIK